MPSYRAGVVSVMLDSRPGLQRVLVDLGAGGERAYVLTQLVGPVAVGDRVVVNTAAVELDLGTGGWHVVHWNLAREAWSAPAAVLADTALKLRYTSLQVDVGVDRVAADAPVNAILARMPVVVGTVHSQLAAVAVAFKQRRPDKRLVYVMTDGGALPIALSDLVWDLRARGLLDATVTCGHAFGGDHEAVSIPSAFAAARELAHADAVVVAMGPGGVGTASRLGFSGIEAAAVLDTVAALGGKPILAVRVSFADPRKRHEGVSHHAATVLDAVRCAVRIPVPRVGQVAEERIHRDLAAVGGADRHEIVDVAVPDIVGLFREHGLAITSMGRPAADDPVFHAAAGAAGVVAASTVQ
jgi:hypothetical protein